MKSVELFLVKTSRTNYTKQKLKHKSSMTNYRTNVKDILCTSYTLFIIILSLVRVSKGFFPILLLYAQLIILILICRDKSNSQWKPEQLNARGRG